MQRSDITGRPIVPAASRRPWQLDERRVLLLLFHLWDLTQDQIRDIFHAIFQHRTDYGTPKLRDQHSQRWSGGRRERDWRMLDRPNNYNGTPYTNQEYLDFANAVADINREAANLHIPLTLQVPPTHEYLTLVPPGAAGIPAGPNATQQPQVAPVAGPATAPPAIAPQTQAQPAVIPGTARKAPAQAPFLEQANANEQSDNVANSSDHESEADMADGDDAEHESDDNQAAINDSAAHRDNSANIEDANTTIADIDDLYPDLFHREPDVRPPGPDPGSSFQEAERKALQRLNASLPPST